MSIIIAFILLQPMQIWAQPGSNNGQQNIGISSISDIVECKIDPSAQPMDPVDMNTVLFKEIAKTVHVEKEIVLVPVVQEDGKLIGVVARLDILRQKLNEGFVTIGGRSGIAKT
jgi:predicted transcriptional regulator